MNTLISKEQAIKHQRKLYYDGKLCVRNHLCQKRVSNDVCLECEREKKKISYIKEKFIETNNKIILLKADNRLIKSKLNKLEAKYKSLQVQFDKYNSRLLNIETKLKIEDINLKSPNREKSEIQIKILINIMGTYYNRTISEIFSKTNKIEIVNIRKILIYIMKSELKISEVNIVILLKELFNFKTDRATVYHHIEFMEGRIDISNDDLFLITDYSKILKQFKE